MTTRALQALADLPSYTMSRAVPLDALARLAAAAGYGARGERVQAEHHLGMALGIMSRGGKSPQVTVAECEGLLRLIAAIALGEPAQPTPQAAQPAVVTRDRCQGRVVGPHGVLGRCDRWAVDGERFCRSCATRWQG